MGYEKRTWNLGNVMEVEERHTWKWAPPGKRRKKEKPTSEAVRKCNHRRAVRRRRMQLEMYFTQDDCYITLTYPKEARPESMVAAQKDWADLVKELRKVFKFNEAILRWLRNIEKGIRGAYHIHAVVKELPAGARDRDGNYVTVAKLIQRIWQDKFGYGRVDTQYLQSDVTALAEYLCKTAESSMESGHQVIESNFSASRNMPLPEPEVKTYRHWKTFEEKPVKVPKGWVLVKDSVVESRNPYTDYPRREYRLIRVGNPCLRRC